VTDTRGIRMDVIPTPRKAADGEMRFVDTPRLTLQGVDDGQFGIKHHAHRQIGQRCEIHAKYYDRMLNDAPALLATNVNHWLSNEPEKRMVRTLDGSARAFLSERYRPLDNMDLAEQVIPAMMDAGCEVVSCEVTDLRMFIKAVAPRIEGEIKKGDVVQAGLSISNSEVGSGSIRVEPLIYRLICTNGMTVPEHGLKKYHVGRKNGDLVEGLNASELFSDETKRADDKALWLKVRDTVRGVLDQVVFNRILDKMRESTEKVIEGDVVKAVEVTKDRLRLTDNERGSVLTHLIQGGDLFGLWPLERHHTGVSGRGELRQGLGTGDDGVDGDGTAQEGLGRHRHCRIARPVPMW